MYLLPCPECSQSLTVSPAQAGDHVDCPSCQASIAIPKLGELRQLETAETDGDAASHRSGEVSFTRQIAFVGLAMVVTASLLMAAFCGIRWVSHPSQTTPDSFIASLEETYNNASTAQMIREWEDMERFGVDLATPYSFYAEYQEKQQWRTKAMFAAGVGLFALIGCVGLGLAGSRKQAA
ncbi:MAG: hypothetical protein AAGA03_12140 [Planctomycetota bacterium]